MILSITVRDNDYTCIIEDYLKNFKYRNFKAFVYEIEDLRKFRDTNILVEDLLDKMIYNQNQITDKDKKQFESLVKTSLLYHIKDKNVRDYFNKKVEIKVLKTIRDDWYNGEVVYLFISQDKMITM